MTDHDGPVLAVVGPTASGKSAVALDVARHGVRVGDGDRRDVEIVAVDAFTVYRGMEIATAAPSRDVREAVPHHMVGVLDPWEEVSVRWFQSRAREEIDRVVGRGNVPLLVGGSGLYFRAVVDDLRFPPTDPQVRAAIEHRYADDPEAAHRALAVEDPEAAAKIDPANLRRSVRALEVIELTGERFSAFADAWDAYASIYPGLDVRGVEWGREELRSRIGRRARDIVADGLLDEARRLRELDRPLSSTAVEAIGYREAFAVLDGSLDEGDLAGEIARRTWRYARRQLSWFRSDPRVTWVPPDAVPAAWT